MRHTATVVRDLVFTCRDQARPVSHVQRIYRGLVRIPSSFQVDLIKLRFLTDFQYLPHGDQVFILDLVELH